MARHLALEHGFYPDLLQANLDKRNLWSRRTYDKSRGSYSCDDCSDVFADKRYIDKHWLTLHVKAPKRRIRTVCDECVKDMRAKKELGRHLRAVHGAFGAEEETGCDSCHWRFTGTLNLFVHWRHRHNGQPHCCDACGQVLTGKNAMVRHLAPTGIRHVRADSVLCPALRAAVGADFVCDDCGFGARDRGRLRGHLLRVHKAPKAPGY